MRFSTVRAMLKVLSAERFVGFQAVSPLTTSQIRGRYLLRPREGGAAMMFTFVNSLSVGDLLSAAQLIVALVSLYWMTRKK